MIGAGLGRTGTTSLREALSILLGGPCYHFEEVIAHPEHVTAWWRAVRDEPVEWDRIYGGYVATTDWPGASFWRELVATYPDALVLLSTRRTPDEWFDSVKLTIDELMTRDLSVPEEPWHEMTADLLATKFVPAPFDRSRAIAAYDAHNRAVTAEVPAEKLIEWSPGDGWGPLCRALGAAEPEQPFPHLNTRSEFRQSLAKAAGQPVETARGGRSWRQTVRRLLQDRRPGAG